MPFLISDFLLDLEIKNAAGSNSGVILYGSDPQNWIPTPGLVKAAGEWNKMLIEARGQHLKIWLNGTLASEMDLAKWTSAKTNPDGSEIPAWLSTPLAEIPAKGRIGFQGKHGDATIWLRNIRIKSLAT